MTGDAPYGGLDPEQFRAAGHDLIDWIADYLDDPERHPVRSRVAPGAVRAALPEAPPAEPEPMADVLADFERIILPGITHWNHPGFMAYFANSSSAPGILGELLCAALNVNGMLWRTSPAATELEALTLDWLRRALGLPAAFEGVIVDTASMSTLLAIAAAREAAAPELRARGLAGSGTPPLVVYASEQAHSSVDKAAITLGLGHDQVRRIAVDARYRMRPGALRAAIADDRAAGRRPLCVVATAGTTSTTSVDPTPALAEISAAEGLWLHVDAAYGGAAALAEETAWVLDGAERADSLVVNPHKWLLTPLDCSALYVRRPEILRRAFSLVPEYLRTAEGDAAAVTNYMDYGVQLGRRFRALKLWFVMRGYGTRGLASHVRAHCALARELAAWVDADPDFERLAPAPLSVVCLRHRPGFGARAFAPGAAQAGAREEAALTRANRALLEAVNATGEVFLSHTVLDGRYALRVAIGNMATREAHVRRAWALLRRLAPGAHARG